MNHMNQKKSFFTPDRIIFAVICLVLDIIIIIVANRFLAFPYLSPMMQSVVRRSWMLMMVFALACSILGVALSKTYDMARAYFLEAVILIVCGFWFGVSRDAICTTAPTDSQLQMFLTAHICLTIAMIVFQIDIILNHPLEALFLSKSSPSRMDLSTMTRSQKLALAGVLTNEIQNSRGSDDFLKETAADHTPKPIKKIAADKEIESFDDVFAVSDGDMKNDKAVMHRQNKRYDVSIDSEDESAPLKKRPASTAGKSDKTPIRPKADQKKAVVTAKPADATEKKVVMDKPKGEPLQPVAAQVDKSAYKKSPRPAAKSEWDPMKVARESEKRQKSKEVEKAQISRHIKPKDASTRGEIKSDSPKPQSASAEKPLFKDEFKPTEKTQTEPIPSDFAESDLTSEITSGERIVTSSATPEKTVTIVSSEKKSVKKSQRASKRRTENAGAKRASTNKREKAPEKQERKTAASAPAAVESAQTQNKTDSSYDHISIAWADPKTSKRRRRKKESAQKTTNQD